MLLLSKSFTAGPGYARNVKFVSISRGSVVTLDVVCLFVDLYLDICTNYLLSVESRLHMYTSLHPNSCLSKI